MGASGAIQKGAKPILDHKEMAPQVKFVDNIDIKLRNQS